MDILITVVIGVAGAILSFKLSSQLFKKREMEPTKEPVPESERKGLGIGWLKEKCPPHAWAENLLASGERIGLICGKCSVKFPE